MVCKFFMRTTTRSIPLSRAHSVSSQEFSVTLYSSCYFLFHTFVVPEFRWWPKQLCQDPLTRDRLSETIVSVMFSMPFSCANSPERIRLIKLACESADFCIAGTQPTSMPSWAIYSSRSGRSLSKWFCSTSLSLFWWTATLRHSRRAREWPNKMAGVVSDAWKHVPVETCVSDCLWVFVQRWARLGYAWRDQVFEFVGPRRKQP